MATPSRRFNTYYLAGDVPFPVRCGQANWTLAEAQARGVETGSAVAPLPEDVAALWTRLARAALGLEAAPPGALGTPVAAAAYA